jgi:hypothetical protein
MYWACNQTAYECDIARAAAHASDAYRSQSLQLWSGYQASYNHLTPMETHYANGFSNHMGSIQQAPALLNTRGNDGSNQEHNSPSKVKTDPDEHRYEPLVQYDDYVCEQHDSKCTPSI